MSKKITRDKTNLLDIWRGGALLHVEDEPGKGMVSTLRWILGNIDNDGLVEASLRNVSLDTEKSTGTVQSALAKLKETGFLEFVSGSGRQTRKYKLAIPSVVDQNNPMVVWAGIAIFDAEEEAGRGMVSVVKWIVNNIDPDDLVEASLRNVSLDTEKSTGTVQSALAKLKKTGFLEFVSGSGRQTRKYQPALPKAA